MKTTNDLPISPDDQHVQDVNAMLAEIYTRNGRNADAVDLRTPLSDLLAQEDGEVEEHYDAGVYMLRKFLKWVFSDGPNPKRVTQRVYLVVRAVDPALLLNMSGEEVSVIFGQGRAAESARLKMLAGLYQKAGFTHTKIAVQKSAASRKKMSLAQMGNTNRRRGKVAA